MALLIVSEPIMGAVIMVCQRCMNSHCRKEDISSGDSWLKIGSDGLLDVFMEICLIALALTVLPMR